MTLLTQPSREKKAQRVSRTLREVPVIAQTAKSGTRFSESLNKVRWHRDYIALASLSIIYIGRFVRAIYF